MAWIRRTGEVPERRPTDLVRVVLFGVGVALLGLWAQTQSNIDTNLFRVFNDLGGELEGIAKAFFAFGSIWAVAAVVLATFLAGRAWRPTLGVAVAGGGAWAIAEALNDLLGDHPIKGLGVVVRTGSGPVFPSANVAVVTAMAVALSPYVVRLVRRSFFVLVLLVAFAAMYLGTAFPADVLGGFFLGLAVAAGVLAVLGAPGGRPSIPEVREALAQMGFDVADVQHADDEIPRAAVMDVRLRSGEQLRVDAFGRDQRDGQLAGKLWHWIMYREPGLPVFGSRLQQVEHVGYTLMLAERAKLDAPRLVKTGIAGATDSAMLVTSRPEGTPLDAVAPESVTTARLTAIWKQVHQLHEAGISHGSLDAHHIVMGDRNRVAFADFTSADASAEQYWTDRDTVAVLTATAMIVGNDRAIAAAVKTLGKDRVTEIIPVVQPAALPAGMSKGQKHFAKTMKTLRAETAAAVGAEDVPPLKIQRLSLVNIGLLAGILFALAIAITGLQGIDFASVKSEFQNAIWGYAVVALALYPFVTASWATALMGAVNIDLPFVPTYLTQLACTFLNLITPNGIGGTALQLDYLHKEGVPLASGGSAMVLSTGVGGATQMILFLIACSLTSTSFDLGSSSGSTSIFVIAIVGAAIGVVLFIPKIRDKVVPAVKKAASDIWSVLRNPRKGLMLVGGNTMGNLLYPAILGLCLLAFGQHLPFAELMVVQIGAGMLGGAAPVPGGIGVTEAALTSLLTGFGIPAVPALAAVLLFRFITFVIPPIFGFFTLRYLRAKGFA